MNKKLISKKSLSFLTTLVLVLGISLVVSLSFVPAVGGNSINQYEYNESFQKGMMAIGAGICSIGMIGTGFGQGMAAGKAAEAVSRNPEAEQKIRTMFIVGAAMAESSALYSLVVAIIILFVV